MPAFLPRLPGVRLRLPVVRLRLIALASLPLMIAGCVTQGGEKGAVTGAAGGETTIGADSNLQKCDSPLGTLAVDDGTDDAWFGAYRTTTGVTSIEPMVRLVVQQSNCFLITSLGNQRLDNRLGRITQQQRNSGEFRAGSNQQAGQRIAADYFMEPAILYSGTGTGGIGGGAAGLLGSTVGLLAGAVQQKSAQVTMSLFDIRGGVQIAASEGSSQAFDFGGLGGLVGAGGGGALAGYQRTPEGKATVAAFVDAYNKMVVALKNYKVQQVRGGAGRGGTLGVSR